jgi:hypothetical protein
MTPATLSALCTLAGLTVIRADIVGRQVCVEVAPFTAEPETVIGKLAKHRLAFTMSFGGGATRLWFGVEGEAE